MIRLSWPNSKLSPNAREDRRGITSIRAAARKEGWGAALGTRMGLPADAVLEVTFCPPNNRRRDLDNLLATIKPHLDGMAAASDVDDRDWQFNLRWRPVVKHGCVHVRLVEADTWKHIGDLAQDMVKGMVK